VASWEGEPFDYWIIGYGNPQRRDDGIGFHVIHELKKVLKHQRKVKLRTLHQLGPELAEELKDAREVLLVDASVTPLKGGRSWSRVCADLKELPYLTHHVKPGFLLGLLESVYHRSPGMRLISVQGYDFGFGHGLSPEGAKGAKKVISELIDFVTREWIDNPRLPNE